MRCAADSPDGSGSGAVGPHFDELSDRQAQDLLELAAPQAIVEDSRQRSCPGQHDRVDHPVVGGHGVDDPEYFEHGRLQKFVRLKIGRASCRERVWMWGVGGWWE